MTFGQQSGRNHQKLNFRFGSWKGMFVMDPDFDEPLNDFKKYMQ
ncbi:DUF2281 domain-containing protein [Salmonirosea aquatica]|uniref:DUF2281 domain-containing protein n=1 Tax=Salmonirosea aquatica TaxID=2654236 RepID=A0A7C9BHC9_9BACT|nr:DUF2281 domain-containing protein [Cytophagaceae bacterium SJW1-29]